MYVEYADAKHEIGYYDLKTDPLELKNVAAGLSPADRKKWHDVLQANTACHDASACWTAQQMIP